METDDVRSMGRMDHSTIKLNDERLKFITTLQGANTDFFYEFPTEPDFNFLKVWFMLDHLGRRMRDMSGLGNDAFISGHPTLRRSGLDMGFQQTASGGGMSATPVMLFNSGTDVVSQLNGEYIWVPDKPAIQFILFPVGFSICLRFNCLNFNQYYSPSLGFSNYRRLVTKRDDLANAWAFTVYPTNAEGTQGGVEFEIMHDNVAYSRRTTGYNINTYYQVVVTYDPNVTADQRIKIYTGGIENSIPSTFGNNLNSITNLRIGARGAESGFFYGYIQDFRLYMGKVLTQAEITNLNSNELSIDSILKGRLFVVQYALVSGAMRSKRHKFHVGGRVARNRIHKFSVIKKITRTHTHRFNVPKTAERTRTHKFNLIGKVARTRTHKFSLGGSLRPTKTHKFNVLKKITRTRTHKFNMGGLQTQYVRFLKSTTAGSNIVQDVALTTTPQAVIIWSDGTTSNNAFNDGYQFYYGFSDGTNNACASSYNADNVTTTDSFGGLKSDKAIAMMNTTIATVASEADVTFTTNNARFTWSTNDNRAVYIHMLAISGITNAEVKTFDYLQTTTGSRTYSLTNSGMTPNFIQAITKADGGASWSTTYGNAFNIGSASSPSKVWNVGNTQEDAKSTSAETYARGYFDQTNLVVGLDDDDGTVALTGTLTALNAGSFTINWTNAPNLSNGQFSVLCLQGGNIDVGTFNESATTGNQVVSVDASVNQILGMMMYSNGLVTSPIPLSLTQFYQLVEPVVLVQLFRVVYLLVMMMFQQPQERQELTKRVP